MYIYVCIGYHPVKHSYRSTIVWRYVKHLIPRGATLFLRANFTASVTPMTRAIKNYGRTAKRARARASARACERTRVPDPINSRKIFFPVVPRDIREFPARLPEIPEGRITPSRDTLPRIGLAGSLKEIPRRASLISRSSVTLSRIGTPPV